MRIISGYLNGRRIDTPKGHRTHPMSEKMRGAIFNILGDVSSLTVLDVYAGSGAIGLEAASRGATKVTLIDSDKLAIDCIRSNIKELRVGHLAKAIKANISGWSDLNPEATFDIVLADPPYDDLRFVGLQKLAKHVTDNGVLVLSWPGNLDVPDMEMMKVVSNKSYGDGQLIFFKPI